MATIEVFAELTCPFTHVALRRFVSEAPDLALYVRAWPLELVNGVPLDPDHVAREVAALREQVAPHLFRGFDAARFPRTSIPAFGLVAAAYGRNLDAGREVSLSLRNAIFEEGRPVDDELLHEIGRRAGVEPVDAASAEASARADWDEGTRRGVKGSPHFFTGAGSWFCPQLEITKRGETFDISVNEAALAEVVAAARAPH
jgi:2-hydroxychromene-2-carboxylate isomerase